MSAARAINEKSFAHQALKRDLTSFLALGMATIERHKHDAFNQNENYTKVLERGNDLFAYLPGKGDTDWYWYNMDYIHLFNADRGGLDKDERHLIHLHEHFCTHAYEAATQAQDIHEFKQKISEYQKEFGVYCDLEGSDPDLYLQKINLTGYLNKKEVSTTAHVASSFLSWISSMFLEDVKENRTEFSNDFSKNDQLIVELHRANGRKDICDDRDKPERQTFYFTPDRLEGTYKAGAPSAIKHRTRTY